MTDGADSAVADSDRLLELLAKVKPLAREYYELTRRTLQITSEVGGPTPWPQACAGAAGGLRRPARRAGGADQGVRRPSTTYIVDLGFEPESLPRTVLAVAVPPELAVVVPCGTSTSRPIPKQRLLALRLGIASSTANASAARAGVTEARGDLGVSVQKDEQQRCRSARGDRCICPA